MECLSKIKFDDTYCLPKCSGVQVTSFIKDDIEKNTKLLQSMDDYNSILLEFLQTEIVKKGLNSNYRLPPSLTSKSKYGNSRQ